MKLAVSRESITLNGYPSFSMGWISSIDQLCGEGFWEKSRRYPYCYIFMLIYTHPFMADVKRGFRVQHIRN